MADVASQWQVLAFRQPHSNVLCCNRLTNGINDKKERQADFGPLLPSRKKSLHLCTLAANCLLMISLFKNLCQKLCAERLAQA